MKSLTTNTFNKISENGKVLSPLPENFPDTPLPEEIKAYAREQLKIIDGTDSFNKRWNIKDTYNTDENSFQSMYYAVSTKGKTHRLLIDFKNMLNFDEVGVGQDNQSQWKNATLLKTAIETHTLHTSILNGALDELEKNGSLTDETNKTLIQLSVSSAYVNESMIKGLLEFMERNPDQKYEDGSKNKHFIFDSTNSLGGYFHLADIRHGEIEDRCLLVSESAKLARIHIATNPLLRSESPPKNNDITVVQNHNFEDMVKTAVFGSPTTDEPTPDI